MRFLVLIFFYLLFAFPALAGSKAVAPKWLVSNIVGLSIALDDSEKITQLTFKDDADVSGTLGTKHGAITTPDLQWRLSNGTLQLVNGDSRGSVWNEFKLLSRDSQWIVVTDEDNKILKFRILNDPLTIPAKAQTKP